MESKQTPKEIASKLEGQVEDLLQMYDFAEKLYSYDHVHSKFSLNEDEQRRSNVSFQNYGVGSSAIYAGNAVMGFGFLYLWSRRGANHLLDFSQVRKCYASAAAAFMVGSSISSLSKLSAAQM